MKLTYFNILCAMLGLLCISSCSDDMHDEYMDDSPLSFAVSSSWEVGKSLSTRSISDDLVSVTDNSSIDISYLNYPQQVTVQADRDGSDIHTKFNITKWFPETGCDSHSGYYLYDSSEADSHVYLDNMGNNYKFYAWATIDGKQDAGVTTNVANPKLWNNVPAFGFCDYLYSSNPKVESGHVLIDLKHYTAMLRLFYGYSSKYAKVRNIVLRNVKINSLNGTKKVTLDLAERARFTTIDRAPGFHLSTASKAFGYLYVNPDIVNVTASASTSTKLQLECTYDIYDAEAFDSDGNPIADDISAHRTRKDVTAVSSDFSLKSASISKLEAGKYYDLSVTINPDYLYVLSEHDDPAVTIK